MDNVKTTIPDVDKCKLINLKEELNVFLLNRAVNFSISQTSIRVELEDIIDFFRKKNNAIREARTLKVSEDAVKESCLMIEKARALRISTISQRKLLAVCEAYAAKALTLHTVFGVPPFEKRDDVISADSKILKSEEDLNDKKVCKFSAEEKCILVREWKVLLKDLRKASKINIGLTDRVKKYEQDLITHCHKNEYRDLIYMEFYKLADFETYKFYIEINETERVLRQQISDIYKKYPSAEAQASVPALPSQSKSIVIKKQSSESSPSTKTSSSIQPTYLKRGDPLHCPGYLKTPGHVCPRKTKFFPCGVDRIERCRECHEQTMSFHGARIQESKKAKKNVEPVKIILKY
jgi:hypothetical protein